jgi:hypothetical protein
MSRKRKPLPEPKAAFRFEEGVEHGDVAELLLKEIEQATRVAVAAEDALQRLAAMTGFRSADRSLENASQEALDLLNTARKMRAKALEKLRRAIGHAQRDVLLEEAERDGRSRRAGETLAAFRLAVKAVEARELDLTPANVWNNWPPDAEQRRNGIVNPAPRRSKRHIRTLLSRSSGTN